MRSAQMTEISDVPLRIRDIPGENGNVYSKDGNEYKLLGILNRGGGEGVIYQTDRSDSLVAKIYKPGKITRRKEKKIELMLGLGHEGICFPKELLYNSRMEFVGYLMQRAEGDTLKNCLFGKEQFMDHFPDWRKYDVVELALAVLHKIKYLHDHKILLGDIQGDNILVAGKNVWFVDTDSYQIGGFPCPVTTKEFTPPELIGCSCGELLRTKGNENFAVATLLFKILMQGASPYSHVGGGSPVENIKGMEFSYPFGTSNYMTPGGATGPYYCCWDHLSMKIREAFFNTFSKFGITNTEDTRPGVNTWIRLLVMYDYHLRHTICQDNESNKVYPEMLRIRNGDGLFCKAGQHWVRGKGFSEAGKKIGICRECLGSPFGDGLYFCKKCGREIDYTGYDHYIKNIPVPESGECECSVCNLDSQYMPVGVRATFNSSSF